MVLATNEWLNDSDDDQKSPNNTTAETVPDIAAETSPDDNISENITPSIISTSNDNANTENLVDHTLMFREPDEDNSIIRNANTPIVMAEEENECIKDKNETITDFKSENNNFFNESILNSASIEEIENPNANKSVISKSEEYSLLENINKPISSLTNPITPQALSCALQSVMNNSNLNANVSNNLQNNFLNALGINQLNSSFSNAIETKPNLNNSPNIVSNINNTGNNIDTKSIIESNGQAKIMLSCEPNSHPFQTRIILLTPNIECKVGRLIAKSKASDSNAIFDCKVLSRHHAVLWYSDEGKFYVKDTNSSNGTFINENKLGTEAAELHFGDIVKFGVDVLENSRKEVHGCIIASVKLYLPDGREAISIDSNTHRSQHSGESKISFDELHRLNSFMQEASQREKVLKSKLYNIQNILDATRKNSGMCWQSMIAEDQLLHRIHSLEKKLQIMEKSVPESVLRNEVLKLLEDKNSYQNTAKEALRKVYQERCDAMQMLAKIESAYTASENECRMLRDQVVNTNQSLQDVNARLLNLETEYNEYKADVVCQQLEAKEQAEKSLEILKEKLRERELECEDLRHKISELLTKRANPLNEDEKLAIDKLDAAIADMDLGDDDEEEDDDDEDDDVDLNVADVLYNQMHKTNSVDIKEEERKYSPHGNDVHKEAKQVVNESTIMKWLQNSDLNKKEGSLDIFQAICNESDSSDEQELSTKENSKDGAGANLSASKKVKDLIESDFEQKCANFINILQCVQKNLQELEPEITNEITKCIAISNDGDEYSSNEVEQTENRSLEAHENMDQGKVLSKTSKSYLLLKANIKTLYESYTEICNSIKEQHGSISLIITDKKLESQSISINSHEGHYGTSNDGVAIDKDEDCDDSSSDDGGLTARQSSYGQQSETPTKMQEYEQKIKELHEKLESTEIQSQQTLDIMETECEELRGKIAQLIEMTEQLRKEKAGLQRLDEDNQFSAIKVTENDNDLTMDDNDISIEKHFEKQTTEDLAVINNSILQQEEELIMYKEQLEKTQLDNVQLRSEIAGLKSKTNDLFTRTLLKQILPYGAVVVAIVIYFIASYY